MSDLPGASDAPPTPSTAEQDAQTQAQMEAIEQEIKRQQALTSKPLAILDLQKGYGDDSSRFFKLGVENLAQRYRLVRTVRGDGNCYYRAFLFCLCEHLMEDPTELSRIIQFTKESSKWAVSVGGYDEMTIDMFYESLVELLESLQKEKGTIQSIEALETELNEENGSSDYCTWYLRILTATQLKSDPDRFLPFLLADEDNYYPDIASFCRAQVEPVGKECAMVQVTALAEAFGVHVVVEYLDGREFSKDLVHHNFGPETSKTTLSLLYRPGHYDILY